MNKEFAIIFMVKAVEFPTEYRTIINDCKSKTINYFGSRNMGELDDSPGLHIKCEVTKDDTEELRSMFPNYVELAFIEKTDDNFIVVDL